MQVVYPGTGNLDIRPVQATSYWATASNGSAVRVYCDMTTSCGDGSWMRVASLDLIIQCFQ